MSETKIDEAGRLAKQILACRAPNCGCDECLLSTSLLALLDLVASLRRERDEAVRRTAEQIAAWLDEEAAGTEAFALTDGGEQLGRDLNLGEADGYRTAAGKIRAGLWRKEQP